MIAAIAGTRGCGIAIKRKNGSSTTTPMNTGSLPERTV